ncbi:hypothetical protein FQN55_003350 [Onygenales sp. PD_40]|nr:hypothetical protein FQN55_003350 [Onygenales sp. PD_40]
MSAGKRRGLPGSYPPTKVILANPPTPDVLMHAYQLWCGRGRNTLHDMYQANRTFPENLPPQCTSLISKDVDVFETFFSRHDISPTMRYSPLQYRYLGQIYDLFETQYRSSDGFSFLLASILYEGPEAYDKEYLHYIASLGKETHTKLWREKDNYLEVAQDQISNQRCMLQPEPGTAKFNADRFADIWYSLWENGDFAWEVLRKINDSPGIILPVMIKTFHNLIRHPDPRSEIGGNKIATVIKLAKAGKSELRAKGLQKDRELGIIGLGSECGNRPIRYI